jgi:hypothetical protein
MTEINPADLDDQEVLCIAVCWSAMKALPDEAFARVWKYLGERKAARLRDGAETMDALLGRLQKVVVEAETQALDNAK